MEHNAHSIFIVDDDPDDRQIIHDAFRESSADIDYLFANNGSELLEKLSTPDSVYPSLILLDLNMPGLGGLEILKTLKQNKRTAHIPVVVFTTSMLPSDKTHSYEMGANCFITKPDSFTELMQITHSILLLWFRHVMANARS